MSVKGDVLDPQGARHCPNCGATRPGSPCQYCGYPFNPEGDGSPTTTAATEPKPIPFPVYLKVAAWAIVSWLVAGTLLSVLVTSFRLAPAGGTASGLVAFAAGIWIGGRRNGLRTVAQWAIATAVSLGLLLLTAFILVQMVIIGA